MSINGPSGDELVEIYERAIRIRKNDEEFHSAMKSGKLGIRVYYSPRGQEIIPAALCSHLEPTDYLVTIYRGVHDQIAKGIPLKELWAEYAGRVTGTCKGKGGPMHVTHPPSGNMVTTGIVGGSIPIANGLAWASQIDRKRECFRCHVRRRRVQYWRISREFEHGFSVEVAGNFHLSK